MTKPIKAKSKTERKPLTQKRLKEFLHYDPRTGIFTWITCPRNQFTGKRAGTSHAKGYRQIAIDGRVYLEHRLAWLYVCGCWPISQIDHINCAKSDNRLYNLREANNKENHGNRELNKNNTSGYKGVGFAKHAKRWVAKITINGQSKHLGYFDDVSAAHKAYFRAAEKYFGKFARAF